MQWCTAICIEPGLYDPARAASEPVLLEATKLLSAADLYAVSHFIDLGYTPEVMCYDFGLV